MLDDELYACEKVFPGVRILVSPTADSGTVTKLAYYQGTWSARWCRRRRRSQVPAMPPDVALRTYRKNKPSTSASKARSERKAPAVKATVLLISGCQDNQLSADGDFNGLFTAQLLKV